MVALYRQFVPEVLADFSEQALEKIVNRTRADLDLIDGLAKFRADHGANERNQLLARVEGEWNHTFGELHSYVAFSVPSRFDFDTQLKSAQAAVSELKGAMEGTKKEADAILVEMRKAAAEEGVSQHARHFKEESTQHAGAAKRWLGATFVFTALLLCYAVAILIWRNEGFLKAGTPFEAAQVILGKTLIFATLSFFLVFSSRSYLANRHNVVVNRHRQNALSPYTALVKAAGEEGNRDIILTKAAECIFGAQPTGFGKSEGAESAHMSLITVGQGALKPTT
jgi:hypothetical protein